MKISLVQDFLTKSTDRFADKICLVSSEKNYTYQELNNLSTQFANALINAGIVAGDRVAIFLPNVVEISVVIFGVLKAGAVFIVINHTTKEDKLTYILHNSEAKIIVAMAEHKNVINRILSKLESLQLGIILGNQFIGSQGLIDFESFLLNADQTRLKHRTIDLDLACLIYTSGSTGDPKGVMSDHSNVVFAIQSITNYLQNTSEDIILNAIPLSFDYGLYQLLMTVAFGGTMVLEKGFVFPALVMKKIEEYRITGFPAVPTMFSLILNMDLQAIDFSSLRYITNTAAALSPWHIIKIKEKFPNVSFFSMYGLTETKRTLYLPPEDLKIKPDSVGIPIPGTEAWLVDEQGKRLPAGQIGELVVRGRHVMRGYWKNDQATRERFHTGEIPGERICFSGDLFRMDEDGYFYFISRKDDIIKSRGEKVSPKEVENVLYQFPGVQDAAVIGIADPVLGQAVKAFIVLNDKNRTENEILRFCKQNLEDFMVPKVIELVNELPKTSSGKIKKTDLA